MQAALASMLAGTLLMGGCAAPPPAAQGEAAGPETAAIPREGVAHDDARFLVRRGDELFRVNVRYIAMLDESVIAVRRGRGDADESWPVLEVAGTDAPPSTLPFGAPAWRPVVFEICESVRRQEGICPEGEEMQLIRTGDGELRSMYRHNRQVWVVFAACPEPWTG